MNSFKLRFSSCCSKNKNQNKFKDIFDPISVDTYFTIRKRNNINKNDELNKTLYNDSSVLSENKLKESKSDSCNFFSFLYEKCCKIFDYDSDIIYVNNENQHDIEMAVKND